jgi:hypothetical protein
MATMPRIAKYPSPAFSKARTPKLIISFIAVR